MEDKLLIADKEISNRLLVGTGKFSKKSLIRDSLEASGAQIVTVALRRVDVESDAENILKYIPDDMYFDA